MILNGFWPVFFLGVFGGILGELLKWYQAAREARTAALRQFPLLLVRDAASCPGWWRSGRLLWNERRQCAHGGKHRAICPPDHSEPFRNIRRYSTWDRTEGRLSGWGNDSLVPCRRCRDDG